MENLKVKKFKNNNDFEYIDDDDQYDFYELKAQEEEEMEQYEHLKILVLNDFRIDEKDYYYLLKKILNEKYILVKKLKLNEYQLECIKNYIEIVKKN